MSRKWVLFLTFVAAVSIAHAEDPAALMTAKAGAMGKLNKVRTKTGETAAHVAGYASLCSAGALMAQKNWDQNVEPVQPISADGKALKDKARRQLQGLIGMYKAWQETFQRDADNINATNTELDSLQKAIQMASAVADVDACVKRLDDLSDGLDHQSESADKDFEKAMSLINETADELKETIQAFFADDDLLAMNGMTPPPNGMGAGDPSLMGMGGGTGTGNIPTMH